MAVTKPTVGGDTNTWGQILNDALDGLDTRITTLEGDAGGTGVVDITSENIADATEVGKAVLTATDAATATTAISAVPTVTTVNGKALSGNISLTATDVGAVPTTRTVNSKALSADVTLAASDVGAVPTTRTVNGKALSANVTLAASDVITAPLDLSLVPAGTTVTVAKSGGTWPARPTARADLIVQWKGPDPSPAIVESGTGGMLDNVDIRLITTA